MKGKSNQHAKSLGDGVQSFLSLYTDRLLSFIFEMRETGMAVSWGLYITICQPVDIGINKPFKVFLCKGWEKWMIDEGIQSGTTSPPTRELIAKWAAYAKKTKSKKCI